MKKIVLIVFVLVFVFCSFSAFEIQGKATDTNFLAPISGTVQGTGYEHAGVDIYAAKGTPVYAVAAGEIVYSEFGHTPIYEGYEDVDTRYSVKIKLEEPLVYNGQTYENAFYTHLSDLVYEVNQNQPATSTSAEPYTIPVEAGQLIGYSGLGRGVPHLHFSFENLYSNSDDYEHMGTDDLLKVFGWNYDDSITAKTSVNYVNNYSSTGLSLAQLKEKFPDGKYWNSMNLSSNNQDGWTNTPCSSHNTTYNCNAFTYNGATIGWQCFGFACKLGYDAYRTNPQNWERAYNLDNIKPGDIINYDGNNPGHTVFVISVSGDTVTFAECNWGGRCLISWGRSLNKSQFNDLYNVYVAPYALAPYTPTPNPTYTIDTRYPTGNIKAYSKNTNVRIPLYKSASTSSGTYGNIYGGVDGVGDDLCTIKEIYTNGWCKVSCPWDGGTTQIGYTLLSYFLDTSCTPTILTATAKTTMYYRSNLSGSPGYVYVGDACTIVGTSGNYYQIICPWSDGSYWIGWIAKATHTHSYGNWYKYDTSYHAKKCSCGDIQKSVHTWNSGVVTKAATCTTIGVKTYTCTISGCGSTKTETIVVKGHSWDSGYVSRKPTCIQTGNLTKTCVTCKTTKDFNIEIVPNAHSWDNGTVTKAATCTSTGVRTYKCTNMCGTVGCTVTKTETISKTEHPWSETVYYETTHPHKGYRVCSPCLLKDIRVVSYTGTTQTKSDCAECYPVNGVSLNRISATITESETLTLTATVVPSNAINKNVTWTSSNTSVATVTSAGVVTARSAGTATITVKTADGNKTASCTITVTPKETDVNSPTITVSSIAARAGNKVEVTISISNNPGIISMLLEVAYDSKYLTLTAVANGSVLNGASHNVNNLTANPYVLSWADDIAESNNTANGRIVALTFKIAENAPVGTLPITVSYDNYSASIYDKDMNLVDFAVKNGAVEVIDLIIGDLNNDGKVNSFDRTILARHIAGWPGYEKTTFIYEAADVNNDGTVNSFDRTVLARHIAKWPGYLTLPYVK